MRAWFLRVVPTLAVALLVLTNTSHGVMESGQEIYSIHTAAYGEEFCTQVVDGSVSQSTAQSVIQSTLYGTKPLEDWDQLAWDSEGPGYRIQFFPKSSACDQLSTTERNATELQYKVHEVTKTADLCGTDMPGASNPEQDGVNCSYKDGSILQSHTNANGTHSDYERSIIHLNDSYVSATALGHHTVNHETGHSLGFGGDISTCPESSIMYYGCGTPEWPTANDRTSVVNLANSYGY